MRTTVTLDSDVEHLLRQAVRERGVSFKKVLNEAIRSGLTRKTPAARNRFVQKTYSLGAEQHFRWDKALAVAEAMEDGEITRKPALRE